ncbi:MAG: hypothetical protein M8364_20785 [Methylobacter sp.]|uniref:hypothetical protein n=1 Tax=Methylobacter sp. TaxID=2051955 RepID=UPI0025867AB7|nr:hypothetical protein [Methylobacter sp.]MCL7423329.1 hypothetical protein [Methylobacter sp.]
MRLQLITSLAALALSQSGCSTTHGTFEPTAHFAYPNSNVQPMGHVSATVKEGMFLIPPTLNKEKVLKLMSDALAQQPGADAIINYRLDTTYTMYPFYYVQTVKLEGSAAKMQVGEQELLEKSKYQ